MACDNFIYLLNLINNKINNKPIKYYTTKDGLNWKAELAHPDTIEQIKSTSDKAIININGIDIDINIMDYIIDDIKNCERRCYFNENCDEEFIKMVTTIYNWKLTYNERYWIVCHGYCLDLAIYDDNYHIRALVANYIYGLDILIIDKNAIVRGAVAMQDYGLDILSKDEDKFVRDIVKDKGYFSLKNRINRLINKLFCYNECTSNYSVREKNSPVSLLNTLSENNTNHLEELINNEDPYVRAIVAMKGYALDILVYDTDYRVREAVALTTTDLDLINILLNDNNCIVNKAAIKSAERVHKMNRGIS